jgi:hypothetical protein
MRAKPSPRPRSLTWAQVHGRRLRRSFLLDPAPADAAALVAGQLGGVQAQVLSAAEHGLGQRLAGGTQASVRADLWEHRRVIKTYGVRNTLHLLPAADAPFWAALMWEHPFLRRAKYTLDGDQRAKIFAAMRRTLDGRVLTRAELAATVAADLGPWVEESLFDSWGEVLAPAAYSGVFCFGKPVGAKATYARFDQWTGTDFQPWTGDGLAEGMLRHLYAYGPASHQEIGRWLGLGAGEARALVDARRDELTEVSVAGQVGWIRADDDTGWDDDHRGVWLLPQYDAYVLGAGPRTVTAPRPLCDRIHLHGRGPWEGAVVQNILLVDGTIAGMWSRKPARGRLAVTVEAFGELTALQRKQLDIEVGRLGAYFGAEPTLSLATLS